MTDDNATKLLCAFMLSIGLLLNGCQPQQSINEYAIIDEREISKGIAEGACYLSGRNWKHQSCREHSQEGLPK